MSIHERALDRLVEDLFDRRSCGCGRCRARRRHRMEAASAALPAPPATARTIGTPRTGTRQGPLVLHDWQGWSNGLVLADLLAAARYLDAQMAKRFGKRRTKGGKFIPIPPDLRNLVPSGFHPYFAQTSGLYRIEASGGHTPIDIGMVTGQYPGFRILKHFVPASQILSETAFSGGKGRFDSKTGPRRYARSPAAAHVHLGKFRKRLEWHGRPDNRLLHAYEILLQRQERTRTYNPATWTFDD